MQAGPWGPGRRDYQQGPLGHHRGFCGGAAITAAGLRGPVCRWAPPLGCRRRRL